MKRFFWLILAAAALLSCENRLTDDPSARLALSCDTLRFDTVFTNQGSATRVVMLRNPNKRAVAIHSVRMEKGESFRINLDGEQDLSKMQDLQLAGGDSLFLFVRAVIDPADRDKPLLVEDKVLLEVGDHTEALALQAYGWDVEWIDSLIVSGKTRLTSRKPYLINKFILVQDGAELTLEPGTQLYMHDGAQLACYGSLLAAGTQEEPILIQSDRLDNIFDGIPYVYVGGKWDGIYLVEPDSAVFRNVQILSGNVGIYVEGKEQQRIEIENCRIHNHTLYGVVLQDVDALIANSEISNCAEYCAYVSGGTYEFVHTTIASYFNASRFSGVQTTTRKDSISPLYIYNLSKKRPTEVRFVNSILSGAREKCLMLATPLPDYYAGEFAHSYLQCDTLHGPFAHDNVYGKRGDTLFVNTFYKEKGHYFDFHLDSASLAQGIADSLIATRYPTDLNGRDRMADGHPDAGCYERE